MNTPRGVAAEVLRRSRTHEAFAGELIDDLYRDAATRVTFHPADRGLILQLVFGVIRRRATLDTMIAPLLSRPFSEIHPDTLDILRMGVYQLVLLDQIPAHAAVNETIECLPTNLAGVRNFTNALLRQVAEAVTDRRGTEPGPYAVPLEQGQYRLLRYPIFPDPKREPRAYLAQAFSWPEWLAEAWLNRHGFRECVRLGFWFNSPPPLWLRVNWLHGTTRDYQTRLEHAGITATPAEHAQALLIKESRPIRELPGYDAGHFAVQDHASQLVATALRPEPGWSVLDLCAAPGGKTSHIAEMMYNRGRVDACDVDADRLATVTDLCQRLGISIVSTHLITDASPPPAGPYDAVLVDVPCSNTGVLGRRPEVRWRLQPHEFEHLHRLQASLLRQASERVRPGGVMVYSTCSIEPAENQGIIKQFLKEYKSFLQEAEATAIPGQPSDGGYWCRLRRKS